MDTFLPVDAEAPCRLGPDPPLTDAQFQELYFANARREMERWMENGVALGWLIDPYKKRVYIYAPGPEAAAVSGKVVKGSGPVETSPSTWTSFGFAMRSKLRGDNLS